MYRRIHIRMHVYLICLWHYISIDMLLTLHSIHSFPATKDPRNTIAVIVVNMRLAVWVPQFNPRVINSQVKVVVKYSQKPVWGHALGSYVFCFVLLCFAWPFMLVRKARFLFSGRVFSHIVHCSLLLMYFEVRCSMCGILSGHTVVWFCVLPSVVCVMLLSCFDTASSFCASWCALVLGRAPFVL